ncbi:MAG: diguanylate cyclase [Moraxellaceae bacterium]|nr:diguanylate cyclase [Moraxellaceae bacterium]
MTPLFTRADIERLLHLPVWEQAIPDDLIERHQQHRLHDFERLVRMGSPFLVLMYLGMNLFNFILFHQQLRSNDLAVMMATEAIALLLIAGGLAAAWSATLRPSFNTWIPFFYAGIIYCKLAGIILFESEELVFNQIIAIMLVTIVGTLALQLTVRSGLAGNVMVLCGFGLAMMSHKFDDIFLAGSYVLLTIFVCTFIAALQENRDRIIFLKTLMLEAEAEEIRRLNQELQQVARLDSLTGLSNRRHFDEVFSNEWERGSRQKNRMALLIIDVDHFKSYNDHYGHPEGDECLTRVATALASVMRRPGDLLARYGGEEFVVLLPETGMEGAQDVANRLLAAIDALDIPHQNSSVARHVTISIGLSVMQPLPGINRQILLNDADTALYRAKRMGRHCIVSSAAFIDPADEHGTKAFA